MTYEAIKSYALSLGYEFTNDDCQELLEGTFEGETLENAVNDYLNAYER